MEELEIIHKDPWFVGINKPSGLLVHRSALDSRERRFALQMLRDQLGEQVYPLHRLDKPTSGVLLFGLTPEAAAKGAALFEGRELKKRYLALVRGYIEESGVVDHPLKPVKDKLLKNSEGGLPLQALTRYGCLGKVELPIAVDKFPTSRYSLVELMPETGRRHQLRRHMKHLGHPIVGDTTYGKRSHNHFFRDHYGCGRLLLAAVELSFVHPFTGEPLSLTARPGECFEGILGRLGLTAE